MTTLSYDATGAARLAHDQHLPALLEDKVATRIFAKDPTLWGPDAESEASVRLGWVAANGKREALSSAGNRCAEVQRYGQGAEPVSD